MKSGSINHNIGGLFTFALVGVFAVLAMLLAVIGINAYQSVIDRTQLVNETRASVSYVTNKVRSGDLSGRVRVDTYEGGDMLVIGQESLDETYETRIYMYDGTLREQLYDSYDEEFYPEDGEELIDIQGFSVEWKDDNLIGMDITTMDGRTHSVAVAIRSRA